MKGRSRLSRETETCRHFQTVTAEWESLTGRAGSGGSDPAGLRAPESRSPGTETAPGKARRGTGRPDSASHKNASPVLALPGESRGRRTPPPAAVTGGRPEPGVSAAGWAWPPASGPGLLPRAEGATRLLVSHPDLAADLGADLHGRAELSPARSVPRGPGPGSGSHRRPRGY